MCINVFGTSVSMYVFLMYVLRKYGHVTPLLLERRRLPVEQRVSFKLGVTMSKNVNSIAPSYFREYAKPVLSLSSSPVRLSSADDSQLFVPRIKTTLRLSRLRRGWSHLWNSLPAAVRSSSTLGALKKQQKTYPFRCRRAFPCS